MNAVEKLENFRTLATGIKNEPVQRVVEVLAGCCFGMDHDSPTGLEYSAKGSESLHQKLQSLVTWLVHAPHTTNGS